MGSGKTTFGSILADHLQCPFLDLDTMVEAHTGQEISEIFKTQGEPAFGRWKLKYCKECH
jgi:shikimate kinase